MQPIQQQGRRLPSANSSIARVTCSSRVFCCLTVTVQHTHSLRANGVIFSHAARDFGLESSAFLRSAGILCAAVSAIASMFMHTILPREACFCQNYATAEDSCYYISMKLLKLFASLILSFSAAAIGGIATSANIPTWYAVLEKPFFNPPNWIFGPVWTVLYFLIGISLYLIWTAKTKKSKTNAYILWGAQIVLNTLWSLVFFGLHQLWLGLAVIVLLDVCVVATILHFYKINKTAAKLLFPYMVWISFATLLNLAIAVLN